MPDPWSEIAERYAQVADDVRQHFLHPGLMQAVREDALRFDVCLDYGCGPGELTCTLADCFERVIAVDIAPGALEAVRRRLGGRVIAEAPGSFAERTIRHDLIMLSMVITTIGTDTDLAELLARLAALLNPHGRLLIGTTHPCFTFRALAHVPYATSAAPYPVEIAPNLEVTEYHRPLASVLDLAANSGLHLVRTREIYDDADYYRARGEEPHRFAGVLPMFLVLTYAPTGVG